MRRFLLLNFLVLASCGLISNPHNDPFFESNAQCDDGIDNDEDGLIDCNDDTCAPSVACANNLPDAQDDSANANEGEDTSISLEALLSNDTDPEDAPLVVVSVQAPQNCSVVLQANDVLFTPTAGFIGDASFTYTIEDPGGLRDTATVTVSVNGVNSAPIALDDVASTDEDAPLLISSAILLENDLDNDGDALLVSDVFNGQNGVAALAGGLITFTPDAGFFGVASFEYTVEDPAGLSDVGLVTVTISPVNDGPVAVDDAGLQGAEDTLASIDVGLLLANDTDADGEALSITDILNTNNCTVVLNGGVVQVTPAPDFNGVATFDYVVSDPSGGSDIATVSIDFSAVNDAPVATAQSLSTDEDADLSIVLSGSDADNDPLSFTVLTQPQNGSLSLIGAMPNLLYTPNPNFNGNDSFTFITNDGSVNSAVGTVDITVDAVNDPPAAADLAFTADEDSFAIVVFSATDAESAQLSFQIDSPPANGSLVQFGGGQVTYVPNANFNGVDSFTVFANDGADDSNIATMTITVAPVNDAPVADDDIASTNEDTALILSGNSLTGDDSDIDGDTLLVSDVQNLVGGTASVSAGSVTFTPLQDFTGQASFEYTVSDGNGGADVGLVLVEVLASNDPPVAVDDTASGIEDTQLIILGASLVSNDADLDGDLISLAVAPPTTTNGSVIVLNGDLIFDPAPNFNGDATISYTITDGNGGFDVAEVVVAVTPVNDAPSATDDILNTQEDTAIDVSKASLLSNDIDIDGDAVIFVSAGAEQNGTLGIVGDIITFTPSPGFSGQASFEYTITDGSDFDTALVLIGVGQVGDAPVANPDSFSTQEDSDLLIGVASLLVNDTDDDGDLLTVTEVKDALNGTVSLSGGIITFTPAPNFIGSGSFVYTITDSFFFTEGLVTISVEPVNDIPTADNVSVSTDEDQPVLLTFTGADVEGDALQFIVQGSPAAGTLGAVTIVDSTTSQVLYTPNADTNGSDTFFVVAFDGADTSALATVEIFINAVNDAPVAVDDLLNTAEDNELILSFVELVGNDSDIDGGALSVSALGSSINGDVSFGEGNIIFTPAPDFSGVASFEYTVSDGNGGQDVGLVTVNVTAVNDAPTATDDAFNTSEDAALILTDAQLVGNDADIDGGVLSVVSVDNAINGTVLLSAGSVTFTPTQHFSGSASFEYTASDGNGGQDVGLVAVTVIAVADDPSLLANNVSGNEDTAIPLDITSSLVDNDGSESLTIKLDGVPAGATLSAGVPSGGGSFTLTQPELAGLSLTPPLNFNGVIDLSVTATATEASNGAAALVVDSFALTVSPVNDEPRFDAINNLTLNEDAPKQDINIKGVVPGPVSATDEGGQAVTITAVSSNPGVIPNPTVSAVVAGQALLSFTPVAGASGVVDIVVTAKDNGGTANGGDDTFVRTFTVTINDVNDEPSFDPLNDLTFDEDPGPKNFTVKNISAGLNEPTQIVTMTAVSDNPALIPDPTMTAVVGGQSTMSFTANANASGTANITVTATDDGGTANGGDNTFIRTMKITINAVADQPNLVANNVSGNEDTAIALSISSSLVDTDGSETLSIQLDGIPLGATLSAGSLTPGVGGFGAANNFSTGANPNAVALGRLNADAFDDLAIANLGADTVSILLGNGDGTFSAATNFGVGAAPTSVAVGRFNGDATIDLAVTNASSNNVSILLGNGDGTFGAAVNFAVGAFPNSIAVGRFNGDTFDDLAVVNSNANNGSILLGDGAGAFTAGSNFSTEQNPRAVRVGRFNADALDDLVVANANSNNVSVLLGNGAGAFGAVKFNVGASPNAVVVGRFNGDAFDDIAAANASSNNVSVLLGNGAGSFGAATNFAVGANPLALVTGRFNGDNFNDLAVVNSGANNISVLLGNGAGAFGAATNFAVGAAPNAIALGALNGDALLDLAVTNQNLNSVSVLLQASDSASAALTATQLVGLTLTPSANFFGAINLTATATATETSNGSAADRIASCTVTVNSVNDAPIANAQTINTNEGNSVNVTLTGFDPDGDPITFTLDGFPTNGFLNGAPPNILYTPNGGFSGTDTFGFRSRDSSNVLSARANVTVNVLPVCGNGNRTTLEACDDGDLLSGDGCSSTCVVEEGFTCAGSPSACDGIPGDGLIRGAEQCDDGNTANGDGCSSTGQIEPGFACVGEPSVCNLAAPCALADYPGADSVLFDASTGRCYVGFIGAPLTWFAAQSSCEGIGGYLVSPDSPDENAFARSALGNADIWLGVNDIVVEAGSNALGFVRVTGAGNVTFNGFRAGEPNNSGNEDCTIYNFSNELWNDFPCNNGADIAGFICEIEGDPCGDGVVQSNTEECDDGNDIDGDGCSAACTEELGFLCSNNIPANGVDNSVCAPAPLADCNAATYPGAVAFVNDPATGNCLARFDGNVTWSIAEETCEANGGYLVVPNNSAENDLAFGISGASAWIGIVDVLKESNNVRTSWAQVTGGITEDFNGFVGGEPNGFASENCVHFTGSATWNDLSCGSLNPRFVCEFEFNPCGDGVLQPIEGEVCDDGNLIDGDGCDRFCQQEPGVNCLNTTPALGATSDCFEPNAINELNLPQEADFCVLQFPAATTVNSGAFSENIFGRIFEAGLTESPGANALIRAELGFGPIGSDPRLGGWSFFRAFFNQQFGNNDEYLHRIPAPVVLFDINFAYTYRFTLDQGGGYTYCDLNGAGSNGGQDFESSQLGTMTVIAP